MFHLNQVTTKFGKLTMLSADRGFLNELELKERGADVANMLSNSFIIVKLFDQPRPQNNSSYIGFVGFKPSTKAGDFGSIVGTGGVKPARKDDAAHNKPKSSEDPDPIPF